MYLPNTTTLADKTCISACPTNYTYNIIQFICVKNNVTNNTNNTVINNTTTNTTTSVNVWKYKVAPNYLFTIIIICIIPIIGISKYQISTTNFKISMYAMIGLACTAALAQLLYF